MLVFADSAWHVFSALIVFITGLALALLLGHHFKIARKRAVFFYFWHSAFCLYYFYFSLNNTADSTLYFINSIHYDQGIALGTAGIEFLTSFFSKGLGFSYGGVFLVYNIIGFIGMLAFASALRDVTTGEGRLARQLVLVIILLPGLSFWSSAIGKDALTFMAASMATWGALDLTRRYPALVVATLAFLLARPHMAGILLGSFAFALLFASRVGFAKKALFIVITLPVTAYGVGFGLQYAGLGDAVGASDVAEYFEARQGQNLEGGSSVDIASMSLPMRMVTYMFRPFFFDAGGLLGLVASFENLLLSLFIIGATLMTLMGNKPKISRFAVVFFVTFTVISWIVLANTTANLGIAIRQKWMFLPMLLLLASSYLFRNRR